MKKKEKKIKKRKEKKRKEEEIRTDGRKIYLH